MRLVNVLPLPLLLLASLSAVGCAQPSDDDESSSDENDLRAQVGGELSASVGTVAVDGQRICTAALVDVDVNARVSAGSLSGRQVVLGGACIGKLRNGAIGGAVFVTAHNGVSLATPIVAVDFESQASAGLAIGVLSNVPADTRPLRILGADASVNAGAHAATVLRADENGFLVGASVEVHAGVGFNIVTPCTEWHFQAGAGVAVGAAAGAGQAAFGAAALVRVNGELRFAASIDGQCIAHEIVQGTARLADGVVTTADNLGDEVSQIGAGKVSAIYTLHNESEDNNRINTVHFRFYEDARELRLNGQGSISASIQDTSAAAQATCGPTGIGACTLRPAQGFRKGQTITIAFRHVNNIPDFLGLGTNIYLSTAN